MVKIRNISFNDLSEDRYRELVYFCRQYPTKKKLLIENQDTLGAVFINDMPVGSGGVNKLEELAIKRIAWAKDIELIDSCAKAVGGYTMYEYIILHACYNEGYDYLRAVKNMPAGRKYFYKIRREFFKLINERKK